MNSTSLINDLRDRTDQIISKINTFTLLSDEDLNFRKSPTSWSILECLEHLNRYGDFYLPEIKKRIEESKFPANEEFKSGWLGNYFAMSMLPGENGKPNKMKTFRDMNPLGQNLERTVLSRFLQQQETMLILLDAACHVDLTRTKTSISISKWIKLRLGDTLRVVIYHNQRHVKQAEDVLNMIKSQKIAQD